MIEKYVELAPHNHVRLSSDGEFSVWLSKDGEKSYLVGPTTSGLRRTAFTIPPGYTGFVTVCPVDVTVQVDRVNNQSPYEKHDPTRLVQEEPEVTPYGEFEQVMGPALRMLYGKLTEKEVAEYEDQGEDDWDGFPEAELDAFERVAPPLPMVSDFPDEYVPASEEVERSSETDSEAPQTSNEEVDTPPPQSEVKTA